MESNGLANSQVLNLEFDVIKDDPEALSQLIDKFVHVELVKNVFFTGFLHSVDPVSYSIILLVAEGNTFQTTLIPGYAILNITEMETSISPPSKKKAVHNLRQSDLINRKEKIVAWFKRNLLPVTVSGENIVLSNVSLLPPYSVSDICTQNLSVASQIKRLIEIMPVDFKPL